MAKVKTALSKKLLTRVLSVYFLLTFLVTLGQVFTEYLNAKSHIKDELQTLKNTFGTSLTRAIWELNFPQAVASAQGLMELPIVEGVQIRDESGSVVADIGLTSPQPDKLATTGQFFDHDNGTFSYSFPLIFEFSGRTSRVGDVALYSSFDIIVGRIEVGLFFLVGNSIVKTAFLIFLFLHAFRKMLTDPLAELTQQISQFDLNHLESSKINIYSKDDNELMMLQRSFNNLIDDLIHSQEKLNDAQAELRDANKRLDEQNLTLEQEVAKKTASLSQIMLDLERQKDELLNKQQELESEVNAKSKMAAELRKSHDELESSLKDLSAAKDQLVESERMASLGGLVAGIAHDVNTPLGIGVTAASFLQERLKNLQIAYENKTLSTKAMNAFIMESQQTTTLLMNNLNRASSLIASFKQVAVDQTSEVERHINIKVYLGEIIQSLAPQLKKTKHQIDIDCPDDLELYCAPGIIAQIFTNMIMNSVIHGFEDIEYGHIQINVSKSASKVIINYKDDGKGMSDEVLNQHFDAFFTTTRGRGGSGLGTHIMYNLVTQALKGNIKANSSPGKGVSYRISFPLRTESN
ncbi:sensor histidine kinase [Neptunicella marina]|uniref:histidine kinase n=1 Tax=Neptunicella marina TaxID=2125989 RepID=A0A8J6ISD0_9ALTE|nr:HAMP domain-containing sensor histidine kinase [Neptunicella marina]MBC3764832.1 HAMP domain-containing histidine kinase [Neptunicella marina]